MNNERERAYLPAPETKWMVPSGKALKASTMSVKDINIRPLVRDH
jgi:hypothetical protein